MWFIELSLSARQCVGHWGYRSKPDRSCCHGPLEAQGRMPLDWVQIPQVLRPEPAATATWLRYYLYWWNSWLLSFLWVPLVEAKLVKATIWKVITGYCQGFIELEVPGWSMPLLKGGINWFSLPWQQSSFSYNFLEGAQRMKPIINQHFLSHPEAPETLLVSA